MRLMKELELEQSTYQDVTEQKECSSSKRGWGAHQGLIGFEKIMVVD